MVDRNAQMSSNSTNRIPVIVLVVFAVVIAAAGVVYAVWPKTSDASCVSSTASPTGVTAAATQPPDGDLSVPDLGYTVTTAEQDSDSIYFGFQLRNTSSHVAVNIRTELTLVTPDEPGGITVETGMVPMVMPGEIIGSGGFYTAGMDLSEISEVTVDAVEAHWWPVANDRNEFASLNAEPVEVEQDALAMSVDFDYCQTLKDPQVSTLVRDADGDIIGGSAVVPTDDDSTDVAPGHNEGVTASVPSIPDIEVADTEVFVYPAREIPTFQSGG